MTEVKRRALVQCPDLNREVIIDITCVPMPGGVLELRRIVSCSAGSACAREDPTCNCPAVLHDPLALPPGTQFIPVM